MYIVTKLNIDTKNVEIIHIELEDDDTAYLSALNELMCDIEHIKENQDVENQVVIIDSTRIEVFQKGYITGKTLKYVYEISQYNDTENEETKNKSS